MQLDPAKVRVAHPKAVKLTILQTGKSQGLEAQHCFPLLLFRWPILIGEREHARCVGPFVSAPVDQVARPLDIALQDIGGGITDQHFRRTICIENDLAIGVTLQNLDCDQIVSRRFATALPAAKKAAHHWPSPSNRIMRSERRRSSASSPPIRFNASSCPGIVDPILRRASLAKP